MEKREKKWLEFLEPRTCRCWQGRCGCALYCREVVLSSGSHAQFTEHPRTAPPGGRVCVMSSLCRPCEVPPLRHPPTQDPLSLTFFSRAATNPRYCFYLLPAIPDPCPANNNPSTALGFRLRFWLGHSFADHFLASSASRYLGIYSTLGFDLAVLTVIIPAARSQQSDKMESITPTQQGAQGAADPAALDMLAAPRGTTYWPINAG